jgi:hypothetical protein
VVDAMYPSFSFCPASAGERDTRAINSETGHCNTSRTGSRGGAP